MSRIVTNDRVFTDDRTDRKMVDELIYKLYKDGEIFNPSDMTTGVYVTPDEMWELTPETLVDLVHEGDFNPIFLSGVPLGVRDQSDREELESFMTSSTNEIAENVVESIEEYTSVQDEMGKERMGYERTALIVVHEDTTQLGGFIPLVRALRKRQKDFPMLKPLQVLVHNGTRASLRPFEEVSLTTRLTN